MKYRFLYLITLFLFIVPVAAQGHSRETLTHNDLERQFQVYFPRESDEPSGLIIMLHGANQSGGSFRGTFPVAEGARDFNFITVYPNSIGTHWNVLTRPGNTADDLDFIRTLIETMREQHNIDDNRIFITGYSNGGMMAISAGCELSDILAGVVVIGANYAPAMIDACSEVSEPYPQMILLSTTDEAFPWDGGYNLLSVQETLVFEFFRFNCNPENPEVGIISTGESSIDVFELRSQDCDGRGELTFYRVDDVPHYPLPLRMEVTLDNGEIGDMSELFWQFIVNHTKEPEELLDE